MIRTIKIFACFIAFIISNNAFSQAVVATSPAPPQSIGSNPLFIAMAILASVLLLVIVILSGVLRTAVKTKIREILASKNVGMIVLIALFSSSTSAFAQEKAKLGLFEAEPIAGMHPMGFYTLFIVLLLELFVIVWMCLMILRVIVKREAEEAKIAQEIKKKEPSRFSKFFSRKVLGVVTQEEEKDLLLDHDYDGIQELDNDLPPWWKYGFYLTIISGIIYFISYHVTHTSKSSIEEYEAEMASAEASVMAFKSKMALNVDETNAVFVTEADKLEKGKAVFMKNCTLCHGDNGEGKIGPNFTDNYWLYGNKPGDLFKVVKNGTSKGMQAWKDNLSATDIQNVISYIHTMLGKQVANPKAAEGILMTESESTDSASLVKTDSTGIVKTDTSSVAPVKNIEIK